jgi:hypothetical protein
MLNGGERQGMGRGVTMGHDGQKMVGIGAVTGR